jgi:hypothetical protein
MMMLGRWEQRDSALPLMKNLGTIDKAASGGWPVVRILTGTRGVGCDITARYSEREEAGGVKNLMMLLAKRLEFK